MKLRITMNRKSAYIYLDLDLPAEQWDRVRQVVRKNCSNYRKLNEYLLRRKSQIDDVIREFLLEGRLKNKTAFDVRDMVIEKLYDTSTEKKAVFVDYYEKIINAHSNKRTREIYKNTLDTMKRFDEHLSDLGFEDITKKWLEDFDTWLATESGCKSVNSRFLHFAHIRAVFNSAIDDELTSLYPFRKIKMRLQPTRKRSISAEKLRSIFNAEVPANKQIYIDAFKLTFLLIGINTVDLCTLMKSDLSDGRLSYSRSKTHRLYDIKVEPEAMEIIGRYPGNDRLLNYVAVNRDYRGFSWRMNKAISEVMEGVTTYYARHSWATIAASMDIPKETIAAALGHGGNTVTDIYINFDRKKVDEANRKVIDFVLYNKKS